MRGWRPASTPQRLANWYLARFYQEIVQVLEAHAGLRPESVVIEFGCDRGLLAYHLANRCGRLILSDLSDRRETAAALACEFVPGRAEASGLQAASADLIVLVSVYHHLSDFEGFTREATRLLRPGGALVLVEPIKRHPLIIGLNLLSRVVHAGDANLSEPHGLALWIHRRFIERQFAQGFALAARGRLDNFLWGLNPFVPRPVLQAYYACQRLGRAGNVDFHVFRKTADAP